VESLDWSECPAVESIPGKVSGAWVFKDTRVPVATVLCKSRSGSEQIATCSSFGKKGIAPNP
jgi:uncharacterized protein (DUF433 family)